MTLALWLPPKNFHGWPKFKKPRHCVIWGFKTQPKNDAWVVKGRALEQEQWY